MNIHAVAGNVAFGPHETKPMGHYELITDKLAANRRGDIIRCDNPQVMSRIIALLNAQPLAYVVGHPDHLNQITPEHPDNAMCGFAEDLPKAQNMLLADEEIRGLYLLPL